MKAFILKTHGSAETAFELQDQNDLEPNEAQVVVQVDAFGLNYADVLARKGLYQDAPPLPSVVGYEVVGRVQKVGSRVTEFKAGDRVACFCRFGGYATQVVTEPHAMVLIPEAMTNGEALALMVQYVTAWYCAVYSATILPGDHVLVQAAAGGVGTALVQIAKSRGAIVYGTAGSDAKLEYLKQLGVDHPINYRTQDFSKIIRRLRGNKGVDFAFDSIGGSDFRKAYNLLGPGGKIVSYGVSSTSGSKPGLSSFLALVKMIVGFGVFTPALLLKDSRSIIGCNMLTVSDNQPHVLKHLLKEVAEAAANGVVKPVVDKVFDHTQLAEAHAYLEDRRSMGKVIVEWKL